VGLASIEVKGFENGVSSLLVAASLGEQGALLEARCVHTHTHSETDRDRERDRERERERERDMYMYVGIYIYTHIHIYIKGATERGDWGRGSGGGLVECEC
jgi:hypothetical protein